MTNRPKHVVVVVLGDYGRSPRMQYHTMSLANLPNTRVTVVSYEGTAPRPEIERNERITQRLVRPPEINRSSMPFVLYAAVKLTSQTSHLLRALWGIERPDLVLVQTPPAIPTLLLLSITCFFRGSAFVIDWHNFGYTLLALSSPGPMILRVARWYEAFFGRFGDGHLCVTRAMAQFLSHSWGIGATVLYDQPPPFFCRTPLPMLHSLFRQLNFVKHDQVSRCSKCSRFSDIFTSEEDDGKIELREDRPALIISATSWTPDEDFSILLKAIEQLDSIPTMPHVVYVITGKGPMKEHYQRIIETKKFQKSHIITPWLESADYPRLLGSADLGVSLHTSSSGIDLPMKVVDMFGCKLPVCAMGFEALPELVRHNENGLVFQDSVELANHIEFLFQDFPKDTSHLQRLSSNIRTETWDEQWNAKAEPLFRHLLNRNRHGIFNPFIWISLFLFLLLTLGVYFLLF